MLALLLGAIYIAGAWQTLSMGRWHKPGAAIFPIAVGVLLAISAISVLLEKHGGAGDPMPATFSLPAGADLRRLLLVMAAFALYFLAMPVVGNMIASAMFLLAAMWLLSDDPDKSLLRLAIYAVVSGIDFRIFLRAASESTDARRCSGSGCFDRHSGRARSANPKSKPARVDSGFARGAPRNDERIDELAARAAVRIERRRHAGESAGGIRRRVCRHRDRRAAGPRPGRRRRADIAADLLARSDRGPDHDGRHFLRFDVWRLDHRDPAEHSRRVGLRGHRDRRLSARQERPRRRDADHRRGRLVRRRHAGRGRRDAVLVSAWPMSRSCLGLRNFSR